MISIALAVFLGLAAFPLVLVFGPVYFPWTLFVLTCCGVVVGLSMPPRGPRSQLLRVLGLAALMLAVVLGVLVLTSNLVLNLSTLASALAWTSWLLFSLLAGISAGAWLRARMGISRGSGVGAAAALVITIAGAGLEFAIAPPETKGAPTCTDGVECPRTQCAYTAERRRFLAIERVTAFDAEQITCTYTAWGGIYIGRVDVGRGAGSSWSDGAWPQILSGRRP
jgi:hypothetical protein